MAVASEVVVAGVCGAEQGMLVQLGEPSGVVCAMSGGDCVACALGGGDCVACALGVSKGRGVHGVEPQLLLAVRCGRAGSGSAAAGEADVVGTMGEPVD